MSAVPQDNTGAVEAPPVAAVTEAPVVTPETPAATPEVQLVEGHGKNAARQRARQRGEAIAQREAQAQAARDRALGQSRKPAGTPEGGEFTNAADAVPE